MSKTSYIIVRDSGIYTWLRDGLKNAQAGTSEVMRRSLRKPGKVQMKDCSQQTLFAGVEAFLLNGQSYEMTGEVAHCSRLDFWSLRTSSSGLGKYLIDEPTSALQT